jgi:hypothetical protein
MVLNKLNLFSFFADLYLGAAACPFGPFTPGSKALPLLSPAIIHSMQKLENTVSEPTIRSLDCWPGWGVVNR